MSLTDFDSIFFNRKSIRAYDPSVKIPRKEMNQILTEACRAPSSQNVQPWRFVIVDSLAGKEKINPLLKFNTLQAETSAAMIFIFGDLTPTEHLPEIMQGAVDSGSMSSIEGGRRLTQVDTFYQQAEPELIRETAVLDAGIITMSLMLIARKYGYETCSIGGYDKETITSVLGLNEERYFPIVALSIGKSTEQGYQTYRLPVEKITNWY